MLKKTSTFSRLAAIAGIVSLSLVVLHFGGAAVARHLFALQKSVPGNAVRIVRLDPRIDKLVPRDAQVKKIADGFAWVEGPVWHRKGRQVAIFH